MTSDPGSPTLDQLRVLITVVETGSFAAAARKLNRATSVVSYTIANLEAQLGLRLFDRETTRKPQLTTAGRIVLDDARILISGVGSLRAKAKGMLQGLEGELRVVLDSLLPRERVVDALTAFCAEFPTVMLHLHVETLGAVASLVLGKAASIGVSGPFAAEHDALERVSVGSLRMAPVAAPGHPLASPPPGGYSPGAVPSRELRHFKPRFLEALSAAVAASPEARVAVGDGGSRPRPSRAPVAKRTAIA